MKKTAAGFRKKFARKKPASLTISSSTSPTALSPTTLLFYKPFQVLCQFSPMDNKATLAQWIKIPDIYPAGRLDYDSEGLLLLTNDGMLQHTIAHPSHKLLKRYAVQVEGTPTVQQLDQLRQGVLLKDGISQPAVVDICHDYQKFPPRNPPIRVRKSVADTWIYISISEGRNRQIRRMTAAVGLPTLRLIRVAIGEYTLGELTPGECVAIEDFKPFP